MNYRSRARRPYKPPAFSETRGWPFGTNHALKHYNAFLSLLEEAHARLRRHGVRRAVVAGLLGAVVSFAISMVLLRL